MFEQFPKIRKGLPTEYRELYERYYLINRQGKSNATDIAGKMETWMHKVTASRYDVSLTETKTLEIGAGTLNHIDFERTSGPYDIADPFKLLYQVSPNLDKVRKIYNNTGEIPLDVKYNRILSIAVLEHLENLPAEIAIASMHLENNGMFLAAIPNEGTVLWKLGWKLTTGIEFRLKYGLGYGKLMEYEHLNTANEIEDVLSYFFRTIKCKVFGLSKKFAFYRFYHCEKPELDKCKSYLDQIK